MKKTDIGNTLCPIHLCLSLKQYCLKKLKKTKKNIKQKTHHHRELGYKFVCMVQYRGKFTCPKNKASC